MLLDLIHVRNYLRKLAHEKFFLVEPSSTHHCEQFQHATQRIQWLLIIRICDIQFQWRRSLHNKVHPCSPWRERTAHRDMIRTCLKMAKMASTYPLKPRIRKKFPREKPFQKWNKCHDRCHCIWTSSIFHSQNPFTV